MAIKIKKRTFTSLTITTSARPATAGVSDSTQQRSTTVRDTNFFYCTVYCCIVWLMTLKGTHKVECVGYDGRGRRTVTESAPYPFGLAFHDGVLYWTDWERLALNCSFFLWSHSLFRLSTVISLCPYIIVSINIHGTVLTVQCKICYNWEITITMWRVNILADH